MKINYPEGSEWRKWDLHVHTPQSIGGDYSQFIRNLENSPADVIGLNDYCSLKGYSEVMKRGGAKGKVLFPVVEFRMHNIVANRKSTSPTQGGARINFHLVFDNDPAIFSNIQTWVQSLNCYDERSQKCLLGTVVDSNLLKVMMNYQEVIESLNQYNLKKHTLVWLPYDEYGGIDQIDPDDNYFKLGLINQADVMGSSHLKQIEFFKWRDKKISIEKYKQWFPRPKACIKGSDSHDIDYPFGKLRDANSNPIEKYCWIKADPTFEGLMQITNEPDRVYIGEEPPVLNRVKNNPTKYIDSLEIKMVPGSKFAGHWFDNFKINFNSELTAIIGNKGKGKSALADILGLCGNTHNYKDFSFLTKNKFRKAIPFNYAKDFVATITWKSNQSEHKNLAEDPDDLSFERVKYIPQSFLETLCTNVDKKVFEDELEKVIFSRLTDAEKLGKSTLREIINHSKEVIESVIDQKKAEISRLNIEIVDLEYKNSSEYKKLILEALQQKKVEYDAHLVNKPVSVLPPLDNDDSRQKMQFITSQIEESRNVIGKLIELQEELNKEKGVLLVETSELSKLNDSISQLLNFLDKSIANLVPTFEKYKLSKDQIISVKIDRSEVENLLSIKNVRIQEINLQLGKKGEDGFEQKMNLINSKILELKNELDGPNKEFQKYLSELQIWQNIQTNIIGDKSKEGSLRYYESVINFIENELPAILIAKNSARKQALTELLENKHRIGKIYRELYKPVSDFIQANKNELSDYNVNIDVAFELKNFPTRFFNLVSNGIAGSFCGISDGNTMLNKITEVTDFNSVEQVVSWIETLVEYMQVDKRDGEKNALRQLGKQLKGGNKESDFYNFIFGLDYLEPSYQLKLGDKTLSELSPGERGALLLIFYLFLDKDDIPIIIDQPEENLDNQSVYKILVHFIKMAKSRRQIIIITHNPNLAVVCDAEQVIRTNIDKTHNNLFSCKTGSIENSLINAEIIDVLEGTRPALDNRTSKYEICHN
jgi:predicted ATPase